MEFANAAQRGMQKFTETTRASLPNRGYGPVIYDAPPKPEVTTSQQNQILKLRADYDFNRIERLEAEGKKIRASLARRAFKASDAAAREFATEHMDELHEDALKEDEYRKKLDLVTLSMMDKGFASFESGKPTPFGMDDFSKAVAKRFFDYQINNPGITREEWRDSLTEDELHFVRSKNDPDYTPED